MVATASDFYDLILFFLGLIFSYQAGKERGYGKRLIEELHEISEDSED